MLNITNHQGNANQNHNEKSLYTHQDGYYKKPTNKQKQKMSVDEDVKKLEHLCSAGGNVKLQSPIEHSMAVPYKTKNRITI